MKNEDKQFVENKSKIKTGLYEIKNELKNIMAANSKLEDIAKLEEHEFYLDLVELNKLQKEADIEIQKVQRGHSTHCLIAAIWNFDCGALFVLKRYARKTITTICPKFT